MTPQYGGGPTAYTEAPGNPAARQGDWECPQCQNLNFSFRIACKRCNCARPGHEATADGGVGQGNLGGGVPMAMGMPPPHRAPQAREGDWTCPNIACANLNFAFRTACKQCQMPKDSSALPALPSQAAVGGGMQRPMYNPRPGDWPCPNPTCQANNFASRSQCHKCGLPKPGGGGPPQMQAQATRGGSRTPDFSA